MKRYAITPVGAPRITRADAWLDRPPVLRYRAFKDECRLRGVAIPATPFVVFHLPMPRSWSKRQRDAYRHTPHTQKPDIDNLCKALFDAVFEDDSHIWGVTALKLWADEGSIVIGQLDRNVLVFEGVQNGAET